MNRDTPIDPSELGLPRRVHACVAGDWLVLLDLTRDRYFALSAAAPLDSIRAQLKQTLQPLAGKKYRPRHGARTDAFPSVALTPDAIVIAEAGLWAHSVVSRGRLDIAFDWIEGQKGKMSRAAPRPGPCNVANAHEDFERLRAWIPHRYVCLFNALCLIRFLLRRGFDAYLVFGVRGMPFAAHCWVEAGGAILDPGEEDCSAFTEIARV